MASKALAAPDAAGPETIDADWLAGRVAGLASGKFQTREAASADLMRVVEVAEPELRAAMETTASAEARRRLDAILTAPRRAVPTVETVRALRAVAVLGRIGTEDARSILESLAGGAAGSAVTREAKAELSRLR